jgi:Arc/MetJ-type ribon-helix-helix transcriptional regulator
MKKQNKIEKSKFEYTIRINTQIHGEPANWIRGWINKGYYASTTEALRQALHVLHEKILERELTEQEMGKKPG